MAVKKMFSNCNWRCTGSMWRTCIAWHTLKHRSCRIGEFVLGKIEVCCKLAKCFDMCTTAHLTVSRYSTTYDSELLAGRYCVPKNEALKAML